MIVSSQGATGLGFVLGVWTSEIQSEKTFRSSLGDAIDQGLPERGIQLTRPWLHTAAGFPHSEIFGELPLMLKVPYPTTMRPGLG